MTNQAAVEYLESDEYWAIAHHRRKGDGNVLRPMFQILTDHKFDSSYLEEAYGSDSETIPFEQYREDHGSNLCGKCGSDPLILGPGGADSE